MLTEIIASILIVGFFFFMFKVGQGFVGRENPLSKVFAVGSIALSAFLVGLIFSA